MDPPNSKIPLSYGPQEGTPSFGNSNIYIYIYMGALAQIFPFPNKKFTFNLTHILLYAILISPRAW